MGRPTREEVAARNATAQASEHVQAAEADDDEMEAFVSADRDEPRVSGRHENDAAEGYRWSPTVEVSDAIECASIKDGDVVVVRSADDAVIDAVLPELQRHIHALGRRNVVILALRPGESIDVLDDASMLKAGWQRGSVTRVMIPSTTTTHIRPQQSAAGRR